MRPRLRTALLLCLLVGWLVVGCGSDDGEDALVESEEPPAESGGTLGVMTYNVYVGGDLEAVFQQLIDMPPGQPAELARTAYDIYDQVVNQSDFPRRAEAIARAIAESEPHFVGLQEMALVRVGPPDFLVNPRPNADTVMLDFRQELEAALEQQGLDYSFAYEVGNADVELPMLDDNGVFMDGRLTLFDVLLVRDDVVVEAGGAGNYEAVVAPIPGLPITILRGYVKVDASVAGRAYQVVNTHLEAADPRIRNLQAEELIARLAGGRQDVPVILLGDFNSAPDVAPGATLNDNSTYETITNAGFTDMWKGGAGTGYTCCQDPDLSNPGSLSKRIDFIFVRNSSAPGAAAIDTNADDAFTVGDLPSDRVTTDDGAILWPSDHAGVGADLYAD